jgi:hypothetical protein
MENTLSVNTASSDGALQQHPSSHGVPADDNGGSDDQPPIPSAGSSSILNEKCLDGARTPTTYRTNETAVAVFSSDMSETHDWAHTASIDSVVNALGTNVK